MNKHIVVWLGAFAFCFILQNVLRDDLEDKTKSGFYNAEGNLYYYEDLKKLIWDAAVTAWVARNMNLLTLETETEYYFIPKLLEKFERTPGRHDALHGHLSWITTEAGETIENFLWGTDQPNEYDCMTISE